MLEITIELWLCIYQLGLVYNKKNLYIKKKKKDFFVSYIIGLPIV